LNELTIAVNTTTIVVINGSVIVSPASNITISPGSSVLIGGDLVFNKNNSTSLQIAASNNTSPIVVSGCVTFQGRLVLTIANPHVGMAYVPAVLLIVGFILFNLGLSFANIL
jgi:hypothetical protein